MKRVFGWLRALFAQADGPSPLFEHTVRWTDRLADVTVIRLVVWMAVASWVHQGVYSDPYKLAEWMDDHFFNAMEHVDRVTLLKWHQLPAWNPYWCGGTVGISGPEDPFFGPDFILRLVYGVTIGRRIAILLLVVLGFEGTYRLCRRLDATVMGAAFAAVIYGTTDRFVGFIHDGWVHFLGFELLPWVVLCFLKGLESWRWRLLGGFFFGWIVLAAGTYTTPFTLLTLFYVSAAFSVRALLKSPVKRAWLTPWVVSLTIGLVALGLSFGKLVPTFAFLRQFPRVFSPVEVHGLAELMGGFAQKYGIVALLAAIGLIASDAAAGVFFGGAVFFCALALGDFGWYSPFHILKSLPIFSQLRFPDRYMVIVVFFSAVAASRGVTRLEELVPAMARGIYRGLRGAYRRVRRRADDGVFTVPREVTWIGIGLATFFAYTALKPLTEGTLNLVKIAQGAMYTEEAPRDYDQPFRQSRGNRRDVHIFAWANMGSLYCVAGNPLPESPLLRGDLPQEEYPIDPAKATVKRVDWSPNEITLDVDAKQPTSIYVNQNWAAEWTSSVGTVKPVEKLLTVEVPAGKYQLVLAYKDHRLIACLLVSLVTLLGLLLVAGRELWRWGRGELTRFRTMPTWPDQLPGEEESDVPPDVPPAPPASDEAS